MKNIIVSFVVIGSTLLLSNCALIELPFKAVSSVLDTTSSVIKSATGAATETAANAAPFLLEHTEEDAPTQEQSEEAKGNNGTNSPRDNQSIDIEDPMLPQTEALVFVAN